MTNVTGTCDCYHLIDVLISGHVETAVLLGSYLASVAEQVLNKSDSPVHHQSSEDDVYVTRKALG